MTRLIPLIAVLLAPLAGAAVVKGPQAGEARAEAARRADVRVDDAWIRAVPPVSPAMAAYFTLVNLAGQPVTLTGGKADFAGSAGLHVMHRGGAHQGHMQALDTVTVAPGEAVVFRPGERHLMLTDLVSVPPAGTTVTLCLTFREHADVCVPFEVRRHAP